MIKKIFFIGIGGIGMSSLATYAKYKGYQVSGSDKDINGNTIVLLQKNNISVFDENTVNEELIYNFDTIIITNTVSTNHRLYLLAKKLNKDIFYRCQFLSQIINDKTVIGITGSHGKTTTTAITGHIFKDCEKDPTIFVGGIMKNYKNNLLIGKSKYLIIEADDAYKSFLELNPFISVITSISYEHLETYSDLNSIENAFLDYIKNTSNNGMVIVNNDTDFLKEFISKIKHPNMITYGLNDKANYQIKNIIFTNKKSSFSLFYKEKLLNNYSINLLGIHNIKNTVASILVALSFNIDQDDIKNALLSYKGVERRFQYKGKYNQLIVYDDYAHHPVEIDAVLSILATKKIRAYIFFQPHKYIRLKHLWEDFIAVFIKYKLNIEILYITDVYAAEDPYDNIHNSENLVKILKNEINKTIYIEYDPQFNNFLKHKTDLINKNNRIILLTLGAGVMNRFSDILIELER